MRRVQSLLKNPTLYLTNGIAALRRRRYFDNRRVVCYAPYSLEIYRSLLGRISLQANVRIIPCLANSQTAATKINLFIRHDIDTAKCIENLPLFLEIDRAFGLRTGVYLRADDQQYSLKEYRHLIQGYRDWGFEVGLHTACYTKDDYLKEFERETAQFCVELGFHPGSFTVHGLGNFRLNIRNQFLEVIAEVFRDYGYGGADIPALRPYDHTIHDSYLDRENRRFIYNDFFALPSFFRRGESYLLMTHPCYWQP